ncbi:MAG: septum formation initiator family protein [Clostridium sp.]|jgi:cell division protein FtsB|uniref:FtsB family cell division protein n=1 Tax=Clostridium sp. TaxID=1506 RepID=UPI0025C4E36C|nr:septum formation initiator family protein [Clostridium sp.]MCH3965626.1 septum formation initiator family protein [Clostridium sp.]MCI1717135.1 septum formation initiator family protein [Clostridium sp.]MCI1801460.1 septum formation initiator family protein [Clostridium sp.]MCI1815321.1 septum formation initiator family protein [Clostridium sp.]MCI1872209.1 septum formation initiator family protein [Clostridium sp.]
MRRIKIKVKNIAALLLTIYVCYIFINQQITMWNIKKQINDKYAEEQKMKEKNIKLQDEIKMSKSDMYIEKLARERLGFIKQGETPVINIKN